MAILDRIRLLIANSTTGNIAAFSRRTGIKDSTIRAWFTKREANLTIDNLEKICRATGVSADWLIFGRGEMHAGVGGAFTQPKQPKRISADRDRAAAVNATDADHRGADAGALPEDWLAHIVSRGSPVISDEFRAAAANELNRILTERRKKK